jgi:hypothetical protein
VHGRADLARTADNVLALDAPAGAVQLSVAHGLDISGVHASAEWAITWQV